MSARARRVFDSARGYAEAWIGLWQCTAIFGRASLEGAAVFWGLRRPDNGSLARLGQTMEGLMTAPPFLSLMQRSVRMLSRPTCFGLPAGWLVFPVGFFKGGSSR